MSPSNRHTCPLCLSEGASLFHTSQQKNLERDYFHCVTCDLVFVPAEFHLDAGRRARSDTSPTTTTPTTPTTAVSYRDSGTSFAPG